MKPCPGGEELRELQQLTGAMAEAFGLDRKIEKYKGARPLTLYQWDLDCLLDVIDIALRRMPDDEGPSTSGRAALQRLGQRLHEECDAVRAEGRRALPEWLGGPFDPDAFDPAAATRRMAGEPPA